MAHKVIGLHKRPNSEQWQVRVMVPTALRAKFYEGRPFVRISLGTTDPTVARRDALQVHVTWADTFAGQHAQLHPLVQSVVSPALADLLAQRARARILDMDDRIRFNPEALGAFLTAFAPQPMRFLTSNDPLPPRVVHVVGEAGMSPEQLAILGRIHEILSIGQSSSLARGQLVFGVEHAAYEAAELNLSVDWSVNRPAVLTIMRAVIGAWLDVGRRNLGDPVATPLMPPLLEGMAASETVAVAPAKSRKPLPASRTLWTVRDEWAVGKSKDAVAKVDRSLKMVDAAGGVKPLDALTRQDGLDFRAHVKLTLTNRTTKTQSDVMAHVQALLNWAVKERGYLTANPWAGTSIAKGKPTNKRMPWPKEDLDVLCASPIWSSYTLPDDVRAGKAAAYWVPLIALYGGLRLSEICQLQLRDVVTRDGVLLLDVNEDDDKGVKSSAGIRAVPMHSKLLALGITDYVDDMRARSISEGLGDAGLLFPDLHVMPSRTGAIYFSDAFRTIARENKFYKRWRDFHSFRTTVGSFLRGVHPGIAESLILSIMGHEGVNVGQTNYAVQDPKALQRGIEFLTYQIDLPRVYPAPSKAPSAT